MNALLGILLAQRSRLDNLSDAFRNRPNTTDRDDVLLGALIIIALLAGIWGLSRLLALKERRQVCDSPRRLFQSLCKAHRLRWSEQWLLWRVAPISTAEGPGPAIPRTRTIRGSQPEPAVAHASRTPEGDPQSVVRQNARQRTGASADRGQPKAGCLEIRDTAVLRFREPDLGHSSLAKRRMR